MRLLSTRARPCTCRAHWLSFGLVLATLCVGVFILADEGPDGEASVLYSLRVGPFVLMDVIFLIAIGIFLAYLFLRKVARSHLISLPRGLAGPLILFLVVVGISVGRAYFAGYRQIFQEWKSMFLAVFFWWMCCDVLQVRRHVRVLYWTFLVLINASAAWAMALYVAGRGVTATVEGYVPVLDGASLHYMTASVLFVVALCLLDRIRWPAVLLSIPSLLCLLLSLRRTHWAASCVGLLVVWSQAPQKLRSAFLSRAIVLLLILGPVLAVSPAVSSSMDKVVERVKSVNVFTESGSELEATNRDHVNDLLEAWDVIIEDPILGYGLGRSYYTPRLRTWKTESWGVHNGVLHHWLKFGILGVIAYMWFHFRIWRGLRRVAEVTSSFDRAAIVGAAAFPIGIFVASCTFIPSPYQSFRADVLIFFQLALWSVLLPHKVRQPSEAHAALEPRPLVGTTR